MGLRDRVALTITITIFSLVYCALSLPCLSNEDLLYDIFSTTEIKGDDIFSSSEKKSDDIFSPTEKQSADIFSPTEEKKDDIISSTEKNCDDIFSPIEKKSDNISSPTEKKSLDDIISPMENPSDDIFSSMEKKSGDVFSLMKKNDCDKSPLKLKEVELQEPIAQQSKFRNSYKDVTSESLLKAFNFPEMEYCSGFYPDSLNFDNDKSFVQTMQSKNQKIVNKNFPHFYSPTIVTMVDFPEVEYPMRTSDIHKPYWNPHTIQLSHFDYNNQVKIPVKKNKNKKLTTKAISKSKTFSKIAKVKPEIKNKPDGDKNVIPIVSSDISKGSLSETFKNISHIDYCNITDCSTDNLSPKGSDTTNLSKGYKNNSLKTKVQNGLTFNNKSESRDCPGKVFETMAINKCSSNLMTITNDPLQNNLTFSQDKNCSILDENLISVLPVENEIIIHKPPLICEYNMDHYRKEKDTKEEENFRNDNDLNKVQIDLSEEFTTDEPYSYDSSIYYLTSTVAPLQLNVIESLGEDSEAIETFRSQEFSDELTDYFILV